MKTSRQSFTLLAILCSYLTLYSCKKDTYTPTPVVKPVIVSVTPLSGTRGTEITITGSNFSDNPTLVNVRINGKNANVVSSTSTQIKCTVPPKAGTGFIVVTVNGQSTIGPKFHFIYTVSVTTYAGFTGSAGLVNGDASIAKFNSPRGMVIDQNDNLYIADELNHCIRMISTNGNVSTFTGTGVAGYADGDPAVARFRNPWDITLDAINGVFYVADKLNHCIRRLSLNGYTTTAAGIPNTLGYVDAPGASARFNNPTGVAVKGELADVFVTDAGNHCIRKVDYLDIVTTFAGSTTPGQLDGNGTAAKFSYPSAISWDTTGYLFITDRDNHNVRKVTTSGNVTTVAGNGIAGWLDGPGTAAQFYAPSGIYAFNCELFICDVTNQRIRKVDASSIVSTVAGDGVQGFGDGPGDQARFKNPGGIVRNSEGDYYISDTGNHSIRKITLD